MEDKTLDLVLDVKVKVTVQLGSCQLPMREVLELAPGAVIQLNQHASEQDLIKFCRDHMAHFKAPKTVEFVEDLPKTATGKVQKFALREQYWIGQSKRV